MTQIEKMRKVIEARYAHTVFEALGIQVESLEPVVVKIDVDHRHLQHRGIVHGGIYVLLAESAASIAAALAVDTDRYTVSGMEINANHVRPVASGVVSATARLLFGGKTTMVYGIDVAAEGKVVSIARCTIAVRPC